MEQIESKHSLIAEYYAKHHDELKMFVASSLQRASIGMPLAASRLQFAGEAEDIVQNVFVRLLQSDKMITPITLPGLVYTMARNHICDFFRHRSRFDRYEHFIRQSAPGLSGGNEVESVYVAHEVEKELEHSIAQLSHKAAKIYRLHIYDGMAVREIAEYLSLGYKNVEACLGSARKEIRGHMKKVLAC